MKRRRLLSLCFLLLMTALLFSTAAGAAVKAKKITLSKKSLTINVGDKKTLSAKVTPKKAYQKVKWKSSNKKIATINAKGVLTARKEGKVTITCTSRKYPKVKATCKVTVKKKADEQTDGQELDTAKLIMSLIGEPLNRRYNKENVTSQYNGYMKKWSVGTSANGVTRTIRVYDNGELIAFTFCNPWGSPSMTYRKDDIQIDNTAMKQGDYNYAGDPNTVLIGWGMWNADTTKAEFEKMINNSISDKVFQLVKDTFSNSFYFQASGGGSPIIVYGKNKKGHLIGKFAGVMSYNFSPKQVYFRVKGINPENKEYYGNNYYEMIPWA